MGRILHIKIRDAETVEKIETLKRHFGFITYTELVRYIVSEFCTAIKERGESK